MFLKTITLTGFKSFGARTTLELDDGVTVIVGPNGSGKSNIVEAVAWATGGLSTRGLRADRTEELLFCGAAGLSPASRAEVTLVFDNSSGLLPIDRPEVAITRRHHRSGESQFEINRTPCRLMDITELLAEAGLRRSRYVLLGQGQVEQVLNASPAEHRQVLEEAAGVGKHLWRRDRAIRRLESARSDLGRIGELISDKERRVRPLARQAKALERHAQLVEEVRSLRLYLEGENLRETQTRLAGAAEHRDRWETVRSEATDQRRRHLDALAAIESAQQTLRTRAVGDVLRDWEMVAERMRRLSEVAALRSEARRQQQRARRRWQRLTEERAALGESLAEMDGALASARATVEQGRLAVARLADQEKELAARTAVSTGGQEEVVRAQRSALQAAAERDGRERKSVESRLGELSSHMERLESERTGLAVRQAEQKAAAAETAERAEKAKKQAVEKRQALREAEARAATARAVMAESLGRLESTRRTLNPVSSETRKNLESFTGWAGWVCDLVEAPPELAAAVGAGLEGWAQAGAFEGPVALGAALERLGDASEGVGPVMLASTRFPGVADVPAWTVAASGSKIVPLVDLLDGGGPSPLAVRLLGDVVLVEDWRGGWEVVGNHPQLRAVTPGGDLITARGISLGRGSRLPDLGAVKTETQAAAVALEARREEVKSRQEEADRWEENREELFGSLQLGRQALMESQRQADRLAARHREMAREEHRLRRRLRSLVEADETRRRRLDELTGQITRLQAQAGSSDESESLARRLEEVASARAAAEEEYRSADAALTAVAERRKLEGARYEQVVVELAEVSHLPPARRVLNKARREPNAATEPPIEMWEPSHPHLFQHAPGSPDHAEEVAEMAASALGYMSVQTASLLEADRAARRRARSLSEESTEARKAIERADQREREATRELETLIADLSRLEARRQTVVEALWEMGADPEQAVGAPKPDADDPEGALASAVAQLERRRPVNPYAASDLAQLEEELSELGGQRDDIVKSDRRLRKLITQLEKEATQRYLATFRETAKAFEHTFGQVFPGGRGRLRIVDPADPLGSGVEIGARPQGKRVNRLSLLSGGERALGALAFLFALMKTRPAPFYLLDEMDASLDAANLYRVLEVVRELRSHAQILIITHQPQTAEFGDVLYGVTLPPGGATQVVSRRMKPTEQQSQTARPRARSA